MYGLARLNSGEREIMGVPEPRRMPERIGIREAERVYDVIASLSETGVDVSRFWRHKLEDRRAIIAALQERTPAALESFRRRFGYSFEPPPARGFAAGIADALDRATELKMAVRAAAETKARQGTADAEHSSALLFLQNHRLLDGYLSDVEQLGVRSTMSTVRHWYYARWVETLARKADLHGQLRVLEIGAGAANLSVFLAQRGVVKTYTIVDLPEMLVQATLTCSLFFGLDAVGSDGPIRLVPPTNLHTIEDEVFDVALNFNSFMEMDRGQIDRYFRLIYGTLRPGGLFANVNRRQRALPQPDGSTWDNNPLLYPYRQSDWVMRWEEDVFQTETRAWPGKTPSLAVARASLTPRRRFFRRPVWLRPVQ